MVLSRMTFGGSECPFDSLPVVMVVGKLLFPTKNTPKTTIEIAS